MAKWLISSHLHADEKPRMQSVRASTNIFQKKEGGGKTEPLTSESDRQNPTRSYSSSKSNTSETLWHQGYWICLAIRTWRIGRVVCFSMWVGLRYEKLFLCFITA